MNLLPFLIIITVLYAVLFIPQMRKRKEAQALIAALDVGDDVVTESGIYGRITEVDGGTVFLAVSDGVEIKISKAAIAQMVSYQDETVDD